MNENHYLELLLVFALSCRTLPVPPSSHPFQRWERETAFFNTKTIQGTFVMRRTLCSMGAVEVNIMFCRPRHLLWRKSNRLCFNEGECWPEFEFRTRCLVQIDMSVVVFFVSIVIMIKNASECQKIFITRYYLVQSLALYELISSVDHFPWKASSCVRRCSFGQGENMTFLRRWHSMGISIHVAF